MIRTHFCPATGLIDLTGLERFGAGGLVASAFAQQVGDHDGIPVFAVSGIVVDGGDGAHYAGYDDEVIECFLEP